MLSHGEGYWQHVNGIMTAETLSSSEKHLLHVFMAFRGSKVDCWPSIQKLCSSSAMAETTVRKIIKELCEKELLFVVVGGGRKSNRYQVDTDTLAGLTSTRSTTPDSGRSPESVVLSTPDSGRSGLVVSGDELPLNNQLTSKKRKIEFSDSSQAATITRTKTATTSSFRMKSATAAVQTPAPAKPITKSAKPQTASEAWDHVCRSIGRFDPLYESPKIMSLLSDQQRNAARAAGGLPKISARDRYTTTKLKTAFCEAFGG